MTTPKKNQPERAGERKRDEKREEHPSYGGQNWDAADKRGENERFGQARNDDANPLELIRVDKDVKDADGAVETGAEHAGMGRGEEPRMPKDHTSKRG